MKPRSPCETENGGFRRPIIASAPIWENGAGIGGLRATRENLLGAGFMISRASSCWSRRENEQKEMYVFALVMLTAAWPVGYMIYSVIKLLLKGQPLD